MVGSVHPPGPMFTWLDAQVRGRGSASPSSARRPVRRGALAFAVIWAGACAVPTGEGSYENEAKTLRIVSTSPRQGETIDDAQLVIDLCFNAYLDPDSIDSDDLRLRSGSVFYDADVEFELLNWRGAGALEPADAPWCDFSVVRVASRSVVGDGVGYRLEVRDGMRGWAGERFDTTDEGWSNPIPPPVGDTEDPPDPERYEPRFVLSFDVRPDANREPEDPPPGFSIEALFNPGEIFALDGVCRCHSEAGTNATDLLSLEDPESAYRALVLDPRVSENGARRVSPGRPGESYLVQKLVRDGDRALHAISGEPMPPPGYDPLPFEQMARLQAWISGGALP